MAPRGEAIIKMDLNHVAPAPPRRELHLGPVKFQKGVSPTSVSLGTALQVFGLFDKRSASLP